MSSALKSSPSLIVSDLMKATEVRKAFAFFEANGDAITAEQIDICAVPASPFAEEQRAKHLKKRFLELGLTEVGIDPEGNCLGLIEGTSRRPLLVVSAHLDTVFTPHTDFTVRREKERLLAPGISDDGCGLAALLALASAIRDCQIQTEGSLLFVGTVGEEGEGNLRGVRYLFNRSEWANSIDAFLSFDGPGVDRITNCALGSRRYRVELRGPGGHSWGDFGVPNPVHALGRGISRLAAYPAPDEPRTTFNVGRIEGGTSVNAIPDIAVMEVDLRSADEAELRRLDAYFRRSITEAIEDENASSRPGDAALVMALRLMGERPTGTTPANSFLVELAVESTRTIGVEPRFDQSSTDSNLPISLGIPAITLGSGGTSGSSHTLDEWYDPTGRADGLKRGLLVALGMVGLRPH